MGEKIHPKADFYERNKADLGINDTNVHGSNFQQTLYFILRYAAIISFLFNDFMIVLCVFFLFFSAYLSTFTDSHLRRANTL